MTTLYPNATFPWRGLLQWLEAHADGEGELQIALSMWGFDKLSQACVAGDVSPLQGVPGRPSMIRLTDQGRAKL
jgi:hypothetical protein